MCDNFPILFGKGNRIALNATKRLQLCFNFNGSHLLYGVRVWQKWVLLYEFPVQRRSFCLVELKKGLQLNDFSIEIEKSEV